MQGEGNGQGHGERISASVGGRGEEGWERVVGAGWNQQTCSRDAAWHHYLHQEKIASLSDKPSPRTTCGCAVHALPSPMALSNISAPVVLGAMPLRKNPSRVAGPPEWVSRV